MSWVILYFIKLLLNIGLCPWLNKIQKLLLYRKRQDLSVLQWYVQLVTIDALEVTVLYHINFAVDFPKGIHCLVNPLCFHLSNIYSYVSK